MMAVATCLSGGAVPAPLPHVSIECTRTSPASISPFSSSSHAAITSSAPVAARPVKDGMRTCDPQQAAFIGTGTEAQVSVAGWNPVTLSKCVADAIHHVARHRHVPVIGNRLEARSERLLAMDAHLTFSDELGELFELQRARLVGV